MELSDTPTSKTVKILINPATEFDHKRLTPLEREFLKIVMYPGGGKGNPRTLGNISEARYEAEDYRGIGNTQYGDAIDSLYEAGYVYKHWDRREATPLYYKPSPDEIENKGLAMIVDENGNRQWVHPVRYHCIIDVTDELLAWMERTGVTWGELCGIR